MTRREEDARELRNYLIKLYEDRIELSIDKGYHDFYYVTGYFDGYPVNFEVDKKDGLLLMYSDNCEYAFMEKLIPSLTVFMDGSGPIARYDSIDKDSKVVTGRTIEWFGEVDSRIRCLRSNDSSLPYEITNVSTFVETSEERDARLGFTTLIPLFFPEGKLDDFDKLKEIVDDYSEQDAFLAFKSLSSVYFQLQVGSRNDFSYEQCNKAWNLILTKISSFLDSKHESQDDAIFSTEFSKWEKKWDDYFDYETKCKYMEARLAGDNTSHFYPGCARILKFIPGGMKI